MNIALGKENRKSWSRDSIHLFNRVTQKGGRMLWNAGIPQKAQNSSGKCPDEGRAQIPTLWCCWNWARGRERREQRLEQVGSWSNPFRWLTQGQESCVIVRKVNQPKPWPQGPWERNIWPPDEFLSWSLSAELEVYWTESALSLPQRKSQVASPQERPA